MYSDPLALSLSLALYLAYLLFLLFKKQSGLHVSNLNILIFPLDSRPWNIKKQIYQVPILHGSSRRSCTTLIDDLLIA